MSEPPAAACVSETPAAAPEPATNTATAEPAVVDEVGSSREGAGAGDDEAAPSANGVLRFLACADSNDSSFNVDVGALDKTEPFYVPDEYQYGGGVFCYDKKLWRRETEKRDVFASFGAAAGPTVDGPRDGDGGAAA